MENLYQIPSKSCSNSKRRAFWDRVITDQSASGLSLVKFCQLHGLKFSTFKGYKYPKRKAKPRRSTSYRNRLSNIRKDKNTAKFIPLQIATKVSTIESPKAIDNKVTEIKIVFKNDHKLILPPTITETYLLSIIKIVAELRC